MRVMLPLALLLAPLGGCVSEEARLLRSWMGVYEVSRTTETSEDCSVEGADTTPEYGWFELDAEVGIDAHLVELRNCSSATDCENLGFLTFLATDLKQDRMVGSRDEVFFTIVADEGGLCQALHDEVLLTRDGKDIRVDIESGIAIDVVAETEEICMELLDLLANDPDGCDAYRVLEARKVK